MEHPTKKLQDEKSNSMDAREAVHPIRGRSENRAEKIWTDTDFPRRRLCYTTSRMGRLQPLLVGSLPVTLNQRIGGTFNLARQIKIWPPG